MARLALVDFAASAVATVQRNESGWPGAFRATCSNMQPPVPGGLAVWRFREVGKQIKIGQRVGLLFVAAVSNKIVRTSNARLSTKSKICLCLCLWSWRLGPCYGVWRLSKQSPELNYLVSCEA
jgi:hypothetical protein